MVSSLPKISIVTPNYNGARFLESTIMSVLNQNYPNLEYIIIDGGSTDNSLEVIKKYETSLSYWVSEPDHGLYDAIQKGFDRSSGEVMGWLNSDDMYHPGALFILAEIFSRYPQVRWLSGAVTNFDESGRTIAVAVPNFYYKYNFHSGTPWIQQESTFWRRSLWNEMGGRLRTNHKLAADFGLWVDFISLDNRYVLEALLGGFRLHTSGQVSILNQNAYRLEMAALKSNLLVTDQEIKLFWWYNKLLALHVWLSKLKIFSLEYFLSKYRERFFGTKLYFSFDQASQSFLLNKK